MWPPLPKHKELEASLKQGTKQFHVASTCEVQRT